MAALKLPEPRPRSFESFRNIYTIKTTQDLFDDLVEIDEIPVLQSWDNATSQIQHGVAAKERVFQYGKAAETIGVFEKTNWRPGRFGDGMSHGVWYGALEEETSILEALYWVYRNSREDIAISQSPVIIDRKMLAAEIDAPRTIDLRTLAEHSASLIGDDYSFCRSLGGQAIQDQIDLFLTPSARNKGGTCTPVFTPSAIKSDRTIYYLHFTFTQDGEVQITTDEDRQFKIPDKWKAATGK